MEHSCPEEGDDEHSESTRVLRSKGEPACPEHGVDKAIWGHPLDSIGRIGPAERFSKKTNLSGVLGQVGYRREFDQEKGKGGQAAAKGGQDEPLLWARHFFSHLITVATKTLCL